MHKNTEGEWVWSDDEMNDDSTSETTTDQVGVAVVFHSPLHSTGASGCQCCLAENTECSVLD